MGFTLVGEVIIDGRKGTVALKDIQREATRTSQTFHTAGASTEKLGKSLLHLGLNAGSAHASLRSLERLGGTGLFVGAVAAGINKFGESVKKSSEDYYLSRKALNEAFETSFNAKTVEDAQSGIKKTEDAIESLQGRLAQMGPAKGLLKGLEKLTGFSFGVEDAEKGIRDAQKNLDVQKHILDVRKKEKEQIDKIQEKARAEIDLNKGTLIALKYQDQYYKSKKNTVQLAKIELDIAIKAREENLKILDVLQSQEKSLQNQDEIKKRIQNASTLNLQVNSSQSALGLAQQTETTSVLQGSKAGQIALQGAEKEKARIQKDQAFREEEDAVKKRQDEENKKRGGLPPLSRDSIRRMMANEAVGMPPKPLPRPPKWRGESEMDQTGNSPIEKGASSIGQQLKALADATKALAGKIPAAVPV